MEDSDDAPRPACMAIHGWVVDDGDDAPRPPRPRHSALLTGRWRRLLTKRWRRRRCSALLTGRWQRLLTRRGRRRMVAAAADETWSWSDIRRDIVCDLLRALAARNNELDINADGHNAPAASSEHAFIALTAQAALGSTLAAGSDDVDDVAEAVNDDGDNAPATSSDDVDTQAASSDNVDGESSPDWWPPSDEGDELAAAPSSWADMGDSPAPSSPPGRAGRWL
jgi:hypothetical protein